ncbi:MAG: protein translocase subunit SecF, partial [Chloroflexota bacterium]
MLDIIGKRAIYFLISAMLILPALISLVLPGGFRLGVDFTGETLWELEFTTVVQPAEVRQVLAGHGHGDAIVQTAGERTVLIRAKEIQSDGPEKAAIQGDLQARFGPFTERRFESVGPVVGAEIAQRAVLAVALASVGILAYIWYAFRK